MKFHWQQFLDALDSRDAHAARQALELPPEMLTEIERLGEDRAEVERWARAEGLQFARLLLKDAADTAALFDKHFPRLQQFARDQRLAHPIPDARALSPFDHAIRRILEPKIKHDGGLPQLRSYRIPILSAPLVALPLVAAQWSSTYSHPIFLTPQELCQWNALYDEPEDAPWWNFYYYWDAEPDPRPDNPWMNDAQFSLPKDATPLLVTWGQSAGSLAASWSSELWRIDADGAESFVADLGIAVA